MTIEVMTLITGISVSLGIISTILNLRRTNRVDTKNTIIETANLNNKIDNVFLDQPTCCLSNSNDNMYFPLPLRD